MSQPFGRPAEEMTVEEFKAEFGNGKPVKPKHRTFENLDGMNKLEASYAAELDLLQRAGEIKSWKFEPLKLKLAKRCTYTPDFLVVTKDGSLELHETKGHWEEDARIKIKVAATQFPMFKFIAIQREGKSGWKIEQF